MSRYACDTIGMTGPCKHCGQSADQVEFYKGVNSRCKECHKIEVRKNRAERAEQYQAYEKMRYKRDPQRAEMNKAYSQTEAGRASQRESTRRRNLLHPEKRAANLILNNAVARGRVQKPKECSRCFDAPKQKRHLHAHHHDYALPLSVEWICTKCHGLEHHGIAPEPATSNRIRGRYVQRGAIMNKI